MKIQIKIIAIQQCRGHICSLSHTHILSQTTANAHKAQENVHSYTQLCLSYLRTLTLVHGSNAIRVFGDNSYTFPVGLWSHLMYLSMNFLWNSERMVSLMNVLSYRQQTVGRKPTHTHEQGTHSYKSTCLPKHPPMDNCYTMHFEFKSCGNIRNTADFYSC